MYSIGVYEVPVTTMAKTSIRARLEPAREKDMPMLSKWNFEWRELWDRTNFEYQNIVKLSYENLVSGLIRYAVYLSEEDKPYLLEVLHLESIRKEERSVEPIGKWLLWYAVQTGLNFCTPDPSGTLISLDSVENAIPYYRDIIKMESLGWVTLAPGEDGYAFRFTLTEARNFCR
ncbi:MAG TPA: hypothetical protein VEY51_16680, partial [Chondromyces sp.]|nr:hypothetical protein [Chondromyces sp.]